MGKRSAIKRARNEEKRERREKQETVLPHAIRRGGPDDGKADALSLIHISEPTRP